MAGAFYSDGLTFSLFYSDILYETLSIQERNFHLMPPFKGNDSQVESALDILSQGQFQSGQVRTAYRWKGHFYTCRNFLDPLYA